MNMLLKLTCLLFFFQIFFSPCIGQPLSGNQKRYIVLRSFATAPEINTKEGSRAFSSVYLAPLATNENYVRVDIYSDSASASKSGSNVYEALFRVDGPAGDSAFYAIMAEWHIEDPSEVESFLNSRKELFHLRKQYISSFSSDMLLRNLNHAGRFLIVGFYASEEGLTLARNHPVIQAWSQQNQPSSFSAKDLYTPRVYTVLRSQQ